jgi:hypothetical protein
MDSTGVDQSNGRLLKHDYELALYCSDWFTEYKKEFNTIVLIFNRRLKEMTP